MTILSGPSVPVCYSPLFPRPPTTLPRMLPILTLNDITLCVPSLIPMNSAGTRNNSSLPKSPRSAARPSTSEKRMAPTSRLTVAVPGKASLDGHPVTVVSLTPEQPWRRRVIEL